jgi:flagellar basal-body rod protein FlgG
MMRALYSAASGMSAQQMSVDTIANNLANASTAGFKMRRSNFQDLLYQTMSQAGGAADANNRLPVGLQLGLGTRAVSNEIIFTQGNLSQTGNQLDVAIQGRGFFQIRRNNGELAYTRAGSFKLDREGNMVTADGEPLEPQIRIPADAQTITIAQDGTVTFTQPNQTAVQQAGRIELVNFQNPAGLNSLGRSLYAPTDASGDPVVGTPGGQEGVGQLLQNYIEQSNVNVVEEFVNLIVSQRAYEANSKVVKAADDMQQQINTLSR